VFAGTPSRLVLRRRLAQGGLLLSAEPGSPLAVESVQGDLPLEGTLGQRPLQPQTL